MDWKKLWEALKFGPVVLPVRLALSSRKVILGLVMVALEAVLVSQGMMSIDVFQGHLITVVLALIGAIAAEDMVLHAGAKGRRGVRS